MHSICKKLSILSIITSIEQFKVRRRVCRIAESISVIGSFRPNASIPSKILGANYLLTIIIIYILTTKVSLPSYLNVLNSIIEKQTAYFF